MYNPYFIIIFFHKINIVIYNLFTHPIQPSLPPILWSYFQFQYVNYYFHFVDFLYCLNNLQFDNFVPNEI